MIGLDDLVTRGADHDNDPLAAARGIVSGGAISVAFIVLMIVVGLISKALLS